MAKRNPFIRNIKQASSKPLDHQSAGILDDHAIRKNIATKEGTIEHVPTEENHIVNKEYVDSIATRSEIELFLTENASDIATYFDMETSPVTDAEETITQSITANSTTLIASFASILDEPEVDAIELLESGIYGLHLHVSTDFPKNMRFYFEFYHRTALGVETLLGTSHDSDVLTVAESQKDVHINVLVDTAFVAGDRIVTKIYGRNGNATSKDITISMEGDTVTRVEFPGFIQPGSLSFWNRTGTALSPKTAGDDIAITGQINLNSVGANIITATNVNGDLRLGAGGGTNDLKINIDGKIDIFEELNMNTKKIINVVDPTANQEAATKKYVDDGPPSHTVASHSDTTGTGAELDTLTDNSMADTLHRHSELSASDGTPDQAVVVSADGHVGIGKASPTFDLDVEGTDGVRIVDTSNDGGGVSIKVDVSGTTQMNILGTTKLTIGTFDTEFLDRFTILSTGDVGIGTTSPGDKLEVAGGVTAEKFRTFTGTQLKATATFHTILAAENARGNSWLINSWITGSDSPVNYHLVDIVTVANGIMRITNLQTSNNMSSQASTLNYQIRQMSGVNQTLAWSAVRLGNHL